MAKGFFITGTDTDVGKTTAALALIEALKARGLRVAAMKPVSAGCEMTAEGLRNDDALKLMQAANVELPYALVNPYAFEPAVAPHLAAAEIGMEMQTGLLLDAYRDIASRADVVIVEGAGGWLVPFNGHQTLADLAAALDLAVIQVIGLRLGCLNHALLTQESIRHHGLDQTGWIANRLTRDMPYAEQNIKTLRHWITGMLLGTLPFTRQIDSAELASHLDIESLLRV